MGTTKYLVALGVVALGAFAVFACSDEGAPVARGNNNPKPKGDAGGDAQTGPPINNGPGSGPPPVPSLHVRVAALDDGLAPFDFCLGASALPDDGGTPVATTFTGPIMEGLGVAAGLAPGNVSQRVKVAPGAYIVRFVPADAVNCDAVGEARTDEIFVPKQAGETPTVTVARIPVQNPDEQVPNHLLPDEAVVAGQANVRLFHAGADVEGPIGVRSPAVAGGVLFSSASFGAVVAGGSGISMNGYRQLTPLAAAQLTVEAVDAEQVLITAENVSLAAGKVYTFFTLGSVGGNTFRLLICDDEIAPVNGLTPCMPFQMQQ
jgi:hypothetical protein